MLGVLMFAGCGTAEKGGDGTSNSEMGNLEKEHLLVMDGYADSVNQGLIEDEMKGSARREASGKVGNADIIINYGSPGVRGRVIWNGLVSYDQVWVTGVHWATAVSLSADVMVGDVEVPAGMYGFFTIPGKDTWTLILNKSYDMHLADDYDEAEDVVRIAVTPETLESPVQRLTYVVRSEGESTGAITMSWEQVKVQMPIAVK